MTANGLHRACGNVVDGLFAEIIGDAEGASKAAIKVRITRLRKKLRDCGATDSADGGIRVLRASGYRLHAALTIT